MKLHMETERRSYRGDGIQMLQRRNIACRHRFLCLKCQVFVTYRREDRTLSRHWWKTVYPWRDHVMGRYRINLHHAKYCRDVWRDRVSSSVTGFSTQGQHQQNRGRFEEGVSMIPLPEAREDMESCISTHLVGSLSARAGVAAGIFRELNPSGHRLSRLHLLREVPDTYVALRAFRELPSIHRSICDK